MTFQLGRTYSGYEFLAVAAKTPTTVAYRVHNTAASREELLYLLMQKDEEGPQRRDRFLREMGLRARLQHPNIPAFLNAFELDGHLAMTTEPVAGGPLADKLAAGPLPWREAIAIVREVLSALECAHDFTIVHRGIGTDSVILGPDGTVQLSNFELAKGTTSPQLTQHGAIFGNAAYMSPEQAKGNMDLDSRSDIYSVGAVLYHAVAGRPPFQAESDFQVMVAHVKEEPQPPSAYNPAVPRPIDAIVLRALDKDPARRYATCAEFVEALDHPDRVPAPAPAPAARANLAAAPSPSFVAALLERWRSLFSSGSAPVRER